MDSAEFSIFQSTPEWEQRKAGFFRFPADEPGEDSIIIECGKAKAAEWTAELNRHEYLERWAAKIGYSIVPLHAPINGEPDGLTIEEVTADPNQCSVEDDVFLRLDKDSLRAAVKKLSRKEQLIIYLLFLKEPPLSISECAQALRLARPSVYYLRSNIIEKLRALMNVHLGSGN